MVSGVTEGAVKATAAADEATAVTYGFWLGIYRLGNSVFKVLTRAYLIMVFLVIIVYSSIQAKFKNDR